MIKNIALREQLIWSPCKINLQTETFENLELLSIDEIKNSTVFKKVNLKNRYIIYFNENNYGFCFDYLKLMNYDSEKFNNEIQRAENGVLNKIVEMKKKQIKKQNKRKYKNEIIYS